MTLLLAPLALVACDDGGGGAPASRAFGSYAVPPEASVRVELPGRRLTEGARVLSCTPSADVQARAARADSEIYAGTRALVSQDLDYRVMARPLEALWFDVADRTGCWWTEAINLGTVTVEIENNPADMRLARYIRPDDVSYQHLPNVFQAICVHPQGWSEAEARANAQRAATAYRNEYDRIRTEFQQLVERIGSAAFQQVDYIEQLSAADERIRKQFRCSLITALRV